VLSASTTQELEALLGDFDTTRHQPRPVASYEGYNLVRHRGTIYGVPQVAGPVDVSQEEQRRRAGVISGETCQKVQELIRSALDAVPIEFAGWLPIYEASGNCGRHPQFTHTAKPPQGYRFTCSAPPRRHGASRWQRLVRRLIKSVSRRAVVLWLLIRLPCSVLGGGAGFAPRARLRALVAMVRLFFLLVCRGARVGAVLRFLRSRHHQSQVLLAPHRGLIFFPSMPFTYGQNPWVVEIEDAATLFCPFVANGQTSDLQLVDSPYFPIVKTLLESDECKAIVTHMQSTARMLPVLFGSDTIRAKVCYTPLGVKPAGRWQCHEESEHLHLLFTTSWHQKPSSFYVRGGLDVLEAFAILHERYPHLRLTLRTNLPPLDDHYHRIIEQGWVRIINRFLSAEEMETLLADSHVFLLPAARVHIVSLLEAMSHGLVVVTSDGWGFEEYVAHERNGVIVKGRYGKVSWADEKAGMLREDYEPMLTCDPTVVDGLVAAVSGLVEDRDLRQRLGRTARLDVQTTYSLQRWNRGLKEALDQALAPTSRPRHTAG
jgi:glycosyltransferase involved in cell wall biosynthesis